MSLFTRTSRGGRGAACGKKISGLTPHTNETAPSDTLISVREKASHPYIQLQTLLRALALGRSQFKRSKSGLGFRILNSTDSSQSPVLIG